MTTRQQTQKRTVTFISIINLELFGDSGCIEGILYNKNNVH